MTKVSVFGEQPIEKKELKKIELIRYLDKSLFFATVKEIKASEFDNALLLESDYCNSGLDLIFVFDDEKGEETLFLGHWNDGVV